MINAKIKPFEEIVDNLDRYKNILIVGCGGCVSVCFTGGQHEVNELSAELKTHYSSTVQEKNFRGFTVERQCNEIFFTELEDIAYDYDCILSMACGAGTQLVAEKFRTIPVFPAVNTVSIGVDRSFGVYEERCKACGDCVLAYTAGICPVSRCSKRIFNGPCGGTNNGKCEINSELNCAWFDIYERLKEQDRLDNILKIRPSSNWKNQIPRTTVTVE